MIVSTLQKVWYSETEPGDGTHYAFAIIEHESEFIIANRNCFSAPNVIYKNAVKRNAVYKRDCISHKDAILMADVAREYDCNICTVIELFRIIQEIMRGHYA